MTNEELTAIYNKANGIAEGKRPPITTARIFAAMRTAMEAEQQRCAKVCERIGGKMTDDCDGAQPGFWPDQVAHRCATEIMMRPNGEVRGASRLAGEASSAEGATSTVVLCGADLEE